MYNGVGLNLLNFDISVGILLAAGFVVVSCLLAIKIEKI